MRAISEGRPRLPLLAGFLAILLFCSPAEALRMLLTIRFTPMATLSGPRVGAKLRLQRKTPPLPIELTRRLMIRKADVARLPAPFDRGLRESWVLAMNGPGFRDPGPEAQLKRPAYLRSFLPSSPQNPVYPPAEPVPLIL